MNRHITRVAGIVLLLCSLRPALAATRETTAFYVGSHGWHTSIIVPRSEIPRDAWPRGVADKTFERYEFLELGWGDRKFYTAPKPTVPMALDAALSPGPSVLHIVGLHPPLDQALPWSALVRVRCTHREMANLCRALGNSFERKPSGNVASIQPGLYGLTSRFYPARGRYYLLNTCDTWTASMMRAGGLDVRMDLAGTYSAGAVVAQARRAVSKRDPR